MSKWFIIPDKRKKSNDETQGNSSSSNENKLIQSHTNKKINSQEKQTVRNEPQSGSEWSEDDSNDLEDEFSPPANFREWQEKLLRKNLSENFESKAFSHLHYI